MSNVHMPSPAVYAVTKEGQQDQERLNSLGFPQPVVTAFLRTASVTNGVVMSRAPGGAGTERIRHGNELKGFLIKAKSCKRGPMAGFLRQIPALNHAGGKRVACNHSLERRKV